MTSLVVAACATAPAPADPLAALPARAAQDLSCPAHLLQIAPVGAETFGPKAQPLYEEAQGCGMHVLYVATDKGYVLSSPKPHRPPREENWVDVR
jgi:hypothetical protein